MQHVSLSVTSEAIAINNAWDVVCAQAAARSFARRAGFGSRGQWETAIAVSEAATNILKYAGPGTINLRLIFEPIACLEIEAVDDGPGIDDPEAAMKDGFSEGRFLSPEVDLFSRRGIGSGLPAIRRMMDYVSVRPKRKGGTVLVARKYLRAG